MDQAREYDGVSRWLGTRLDWHAVRRDAVLAGVFAGLNVLAGTLSWIWLPTGIAFGAGVGAFLHLRPAEPAPDDDWRGRIVVRGISGLVGGAWSAAGVAVLVSGAVDDPERLPGLASLAPHLIIGGLTGAAWYVAWGWWETRSLRRNAARVAA